MKINWNGLKFWEKVFVISLILSLFCLGFLVGEALQLKIGLLVCIPPFLLFLLTSVLAILDQSDKGF